MVVLPCGSTPFKPLAALATGAIAIAGAVGLIDRVAPLCFAAPVFFHSVRGYFGV